MLSHLSLYCSFNEGLSVNMTRFSDRYSSTKHSRHQSSHASNLFEPAISTTDTGISGIKRLPLHVHEMLNHAGAQLASHNQKALESGYEDKITRMGSLKAMTSQGNLNTLDICRGKLDFRDGHETIPRITAAGSRYTYAHAPITRLVTSSPILVARSRSKLTIWTAWLRGSPHQVLFTVNCKPKKACELYLPRLHKRHLKSMP